VDDDEDDPVSVARKKARKPKKLPSLVKTSASSTGTTAYWPPERFAAKTAVEGGDDAALLYGATPEMDMWSVGTLADARCDDCVMLGLNANCLVFVDRKVSFSLSC
jgi:hypothetical protein